MAMHACVECMRCFGRDDGNSAGIHHLHLRFFTTTIISQNLKSKG